MTSLQSSRMPTVICVSFGFGEDNANITNCLANNANRVRDNANGSKNEANDSEMGEYFSRALLAVIK